MGGGMIRGSMVYIGSPRALKRGFGKVIKESLQEAGMLWHRRYLPDHFRRGAASKYGYQKRTADYMKRKARRKGHQAPLVFSGDLKRTVTRTAHVGGTSKQVKVSMPAPWYATRNWKTRGTMPDMPKEITKSTDAQVRRLARIVEVLSERKLGEIQTRETRA
jgi:hypothetical protein